MGWCPVCNQDWQVILKSSDGTLAIVCLECLSRWLHLEDAKEHQKVAGDFILKREKNCMTMFQHINKLLNVDGISFLLHSKLSEN